MGAKSSKTLKPQQCTALDVCCIRLSGQEVRCEPAGKVECHALAPNQNAEQQGFGDFSHSAPGYPEENNIMKILRRIPV